MNLPWLDSTTIPPHSRKALETPSFKWFSMDRSEQPSPLTAERHWRLPFQSRGFPSSLQQPFPLTAERHWRHADTISARAGEFVSHPPSQPKGIGDPYGDCAPRHEEHGSHPPSQPKGIGDLGCLFEALVRLSAAIPPHSRKALETISSSFFTVVDNYAAIPPHRRKALETSSHRAGRVGFLRSAIPPHSRKALDTRRVKGCNIVSDSQPSPLTAEMHWRPDLLRTVVFRLLRAHRPTPPKGIGDSEAVDEEIH